MVIEGHEQFVEKDQDLLKHGQDMITCCCRCKFGEFFQTWFEVIVLLVCPLPFYERYILIEYAYSSND